MDDGELNFLLESWTGIGSQFIGECFDKAKPFIDNNFDQIDPFLRFVSAQLFIDCQLTSESVLILARQGKEWDADLILRSVAEGSLKYLYMMTGSSQEMLEKAIEYWETLPSFSAIQRSERAKRFLGSVPDANAPEWIPIRDIIIDDAEVESIRQKFNRNARKAMEEKWSFAGITRYFGSSNEEYMKGIVDLSHNYSMSSHLLHKDGDGVGMVWDRYTRSSERYQAVKVGHSARVISDTCNYARLRVLFLLKACSQQANFFSEIGIKYNQFFESMYEASKEFVNVEYKVSN